MNKDTSGSAFPWTSDKAGVVHKGMTLRDYFAAKAMQGLLAGGEYGVCDGCAIDAYEMADTMLKARKM
mgnify:CR=1 FL=1